VVSGTDAGKGCVSRFGGFGVRHCSGRSSCRLLACNGTSADREHLANLLVAAMHS
jgi:hypothetical protein